MPAQLRSTRALTMIEMMAVVVILGIVLFLTLPHFTGSKASSELAAIKGKATQLNLAKDSFIATRGINAAQTAWDAAGSNGAKYLLLAAYLPPPAPATLTAFTIPGYIFVMPTSPLTFPVELYQDVNLNTALDTGEPSIPYQ